MSEYEGVSISYQNNSPTAAQRAPVDLTQIPVAFADCDLIPVDEARMLVVNRRNGKQQMIAPQVVEALKDCTTFNTIAAHTQRLCNTRPELKGQNKVVGDTIFGLLQQGFLLRADEIAEKLNNQSASRRARTKVFINTCDRPEAVKRLLDSLLRAGNLAQHEMVYLIDDSRDEQNRAINESHVEEFNIRSAKSVSYFGHDAQQELLAKLIEKLPAHEGGIRFLIDPSQWTGKKTYGRSRTLCLLLSVGYRSVVMDDDVLCQAVQPPLRAANMALSGERRAWFFPDRETLLASAQPADFDPITGHLRCLGANLGDALTDLHGRPFTAQDLLHCNAAMLNELSMDSPVLVTQCGTWGDPGTGNVHWVTNLGEDSIERLVNAPNGMANALENRCTWVGCPQPTLHKMAVMSQITGIDHSRLLPPYFPAFRGEDLLFGAMIESMYHHGAVIEYEWAVPHLPVDDRAGPGLRAPMAGQGGIALFARYLTENINYKDASDALRKLHFMAEDARRLAARSDEDLVLDYRREQAKAQAQQLYQLRLQRRRADELPSQNWQSYLDRGVEEVSQSLQKAHSPLDIDGVSAASEAELITEFRHLATGWANALDAWPAMREQMA